MNSTQFNQKWSDYLEERHYGLAFENEDAISFLDNLFTQLTKLGVEFKYYQIKLKFGDARFYSTLPRVLNRLVERELNRICGDGSE